MDRLRRIVAQTGTNPNKRHRLSHLEPRPVSVPLKRKLRRRRHEGQEDSYARSRVQRGPGQVDGGPGGPRPQQVAPGHPAGRDRSAREATFRVECREWTDAQIGNNDSANDVRDVDLNDRAHALRADRRSRAPSRATCSSSTSSTSARASRRRSTATRPARDGATPASSPRSTAAGSSPTTSRTPTRRSGTSAARTPRPGTSPGSVTPASPTPGCSGPRRRPSCWPSGTAASRH